MKRALYSIDDEEFMTLLERTDEVLRAKSIPYLIVGGVASQAHIVNYICQKEKGTTLYDLSHSNDFRVQDHFRATDDIDITLDTRKISEDSSNVEIPREVMNALGQIEGDGIYTSSTGDHLVAIKLERQGIKRPIFRLGFDKEADSPDSEISFNLYYGPYDTNNRWSREMIDFENANYFDFFETGKRLSLPVFQERKVELNVKGVEELIATKIARAREKDWTDVLLLYRHSNEANQPIDISKIEKLLCAEDQKYHTVNETLTSRFGKFLALIK